MKAISLLLVMMLCAPVFAQTAGKQMVVVAAVGEDPKPGLRKSLETQIKIAFVKDGKFTAIAREEAVLDAIGKEHLYQQSGAVDDKQIKRLGMQSGAQYVCVVDVSPLLNSFMLNAQLVDVESANIIASASVPNDLKNSGDFLAASEELVHQLLGTPGGRQGGRYGSGIFLEEARNANPLTAELATVLKQKVTVSGGTCLGGVTVSIESDPEPVCTDGSIGFSCRANVSLVITQCKGGGKTVLRGSLASTDRSSTANARKQLERNVATANFWGDWVKELEKWSK